MNRIPLVDLKAQYRTIRDEIDAALAGVFDHCEFILGSTVDEFEAAFARYIGTKECVGVASGTDALRIALKGLEIGPGDKVLLPANTFIATALAISDVGATPVLVDIDPQTFTIDVDAARTSAGRRREGDHASAPLRAACRYDGGDGFGPRERLARDRRCRAGSRGTPSAGPLWLAGDRVRL